MQDVECFERGEENREIAAALRVGGRSVKRWRRQWREQGEAGVLSKGSPGGRGSVRSRSPSWSGSWSAAPWPTAGSTSGGPWPG
ncbi:helix-turn-helix domain-containing protein [Streptomyces sp. NPDC057027]|uniref:helix-turn-helix domain-containing protein n=1 Tax=Streptomyces sp. NPDC057027 TaxID=3346004 RepID=UPI00363CE460